MIMNIFINIIMIIIIIIIIFIIIIFIIIIVIIINLIKYKYVLKKTKKQKKNTGSEAEDLLKAISIAFSDNSPSYDNNRTCFFKSEKYSIASLVVEVPNP